MDALVIASTHPDRRHYQDVIRQYCDRYLVSGDQDMGEGKGQGNTIRRGRKRVKEGSRMTGGGQKSVVFVVLLPQPTLRDQAPSGSRGLCLARTQMPKHQTRIRSHYRSGSQWLTGALSCTSTGAGFSALHHVPEHLGLPKGRRVLGSRAAGAPGSGARDGTAPINPEVAPFRTGLITFDNSYGLGPVMVRRPSARGPFFVVINMTWSCARVHQVDRSQKSFGRF
jgi:hypothetical protein